MSLVNKSVRTVQLRLLGMKDLFAEAAMHQSEADIAVEAINGLLDVKFNGDIFLTHNIGDGWLICFNGRGNAPINADELAALYKMSKKKAIEFLMGRTI